ncbi:hypothetical protein [Streptomyces sp. LMG1-1-1.1]|uniref:hypothetical protein n=1 Tax=Streptomyces sp. LMG1-1-1.1 TaxID=3135245 RepID=UPI00346569C0
MATHLTLYGSRVGIRSTVRSDGLRVVEWSGHPHGPALLPAPGAGAEDDSGPIMCLSATANAVTARSADGTVLGRTRTHAPVRHLPAAGHDQGGLRLVSPGADAWSAKGWQLGPPPADGDIADEPTTTVRTGRPRTATPPTSPRRLSGRGAAPAGPSWSCRTPRARRLLDGASGALLDRLEERGGGPLVDAHPGAPVLHRLAVTKRRHPGRGAGVGGRAARRLPRGGRSGLGLPRAGRRGSPLRRSLAQHTKSEHYLALYAPDGRVKERLHLGLDDVSSLRLVPDGARVLAVAVGYRYVGGGSSSDEAPPAVF